MDFKFPKNDKYLWTEHSKFKMRQYGLSAQRIARVIRNPERIETGIVKDTIAVMQPASVRSERSAAGKSVQKKWSQEIWCMYKIKRIKNKELGIKDNKKDKNLKNIHNSSFIIRNSAKQQLRIISAWRYPGVSPKRDPIPEDILREIAGAD